LNEYEIIQYSQTGGLNLFFDTVDYRTSHIHPEWELLWVIDQPLNVTYRQQDYFAAPDTMLLISPRQPHQYRKQGESSTFLCLQISPKCFELACPELKSMMSEELIPDRYWTQRQRLQARSLLMSVAEHYFRQTPCYQLFCLSQAAMLLYLTLTAVPCQQVGQAELRDLERRNARLMRLLAFVDGHYTQKLRLTDFAAQEQCSVSYLSRFTREMLNQTFQEYVETVRFHAACKLIATGETKMVDVYTASGFSDYRYFSRAFQKRTGKTSEEYRKSQAAEHVEQTHVHRSIHSLERFYSREKSVQMLEELKNRDRQ
jgi:AraC-like DNA-binding protein